VCKEIGVKLEIEHWYEHVPKSVETCSKIKVTKLWNQQVRTDRTLSNIKPAIIISENKKRTCRLIAAAICGDRNVIKQGAEKMLKYIELLTEIQRMWNLREKCDTGSKRGEWNHFKIRQYQGNITAKHEIKGLQ